MKLEISLLDRYVINIDIEVKSTNTLKEIINFIKNRKKPFSALFDEVSLQMNNRVFTINDFSKPLSELNIKDTDTIKFSIKKRTPIYILFYLAHEIKNVNLSLDPNSNPTPKTLSLVAREHAQNPWSIADLWEMLNYLNKMREDKLEHSSEIDALYHFLKLLYLTAPIEKFEKNPICIDDAKKIMNFHEKAIKSYAQRCIEILSTEPKTLPSILKISDHLEFKEKKIEVKISFSRDFVIAFYPILVTPITTLENIINYIRNEADIFFYTFLNGATIQINDQIFTDPDFSKALFELNIEKIDTINIQIKQITASCILYSLKHELKNLKPNSSPDSNIIPKTLFLVANRQRQEKNPWGTSELWDIRYHFNRMLKKYPETPLQTYALYNFSRLLFLNAPIVKCPRYFIPEFPNDLTNELTHSNPSLEIIKTILSRYNYLYVTGDRVPPDKASLFFEALKTNNTIKTLWFIWDSTLKKSANEFCKALQGNTSLLQLDFCCHGYASHSKYDNNDDMLQIIAEGLKNNTTLINLNVSEIKNKNEAAKIVAIDSFSLTSLSLYFDKEDKDVIQDISKLSEALKNNTSLRSLNISIHSDYLPHLMTALQKNSMLTEIYIVLLSRNIDLDKWQKIKKILDEILEKNTTLTINITGDCKKNPLIDENIKRKMKFNEEARKFYTENCIDTLLTQPQTLPAILKIPDHFAFKEVTTDAILKIMCEWPFLIRPLYEIILEYITLPPFILTNAPQRLFGSQKDVKEEHFSLDVSTVMNNSR